MIAGAGLIKLYNPTVISISGTALPCLRKAAEAQKADSQALAAEICIIYNSRAFSGDKKRSRKGGFIKEAAPGFLLTEIDPFRNRRFHNGFHAKIGPNI